MAMSMATLAIAGSAAFVGIVVQRWSARIAMTVAAALSALSYVTMALTPSFNIVLACYVVLGTCAVTLGIIGPVTLVNRFYAANRGKMLGIIHMPILLMVAPVAIAKAFPLLGRSGILLTLAMIFLLFTPITWWGTSGTQAASPPAQSEDVATGERRDTTGARDPRMLALVLLSLAVGVVSGSSVVYMAHIVPFGLSRALTLPAASILISLFSVSGIVGSPVAGWLCDRLGPYLTLMAAALMIALLWVALPVLAGTAIFIGAALLGFFAAPINTLHAAAVSSLYAPDEVGKAMGLSYLIKLPFLFGLAPLVAFAVGYFGSYHTAFGVLAAITVGGGAICAAARLAARNHAIPA